MKDEILHIIDVVIWRFEIQGKQILEVGARNVNGSVRSVMEKYHPESYIGIDIEAGDGVDQVGSVYDLITEFGRDKFDVVVCTETLEHVENWVLAIRNLKAVVKPGGLLIVSAPIIGRKYHGYPHDFWRFELEDWGSIFRDMSIVFSQRVKKTIVLKIQKPEGFEESGIEMIKLYSIVKRQRVLCG